MSEGGDSAAGSRERLCSPSCLILPKTVHGSIAFAREVLRSARAIHPMLHGGSHCHRQLVPGTEPSPWAATARHPLKHLALTLHRYRGLFQQGSSSVLIQPCIANQLLENKEPSCFFGPGCAKSKLLNLPAVQEAKGAAATSRACSRMQGSREREGEESHGWQKWDEKCVLRNCISLLC